MGQLGDAYQQLLDAQAAIETGKAELARKKLEIQNAQDLINSNANTLVVSQSQIDSAKASLVDAEKSIRSLNRRSRIPRRRLRECKRSLMTARAPCPLMSISKRAIIS